MDAPHILVAEDDAAQREILRYNLEAQGFGVMAVGDGEAAFAQVLETPPDLVILDWMMPKLSGIEACRRIKRSPQSADVPVIMLSARSEESDKVRGLEIGADDYMVKPYSVAELIARVKSNLRRSNPATLRSVLEYGDISMDKDSHAVTRAGRIIKLGPKEFRLLAVFLENPKRVWSREMLLDRVWGSDADIFSRTVDVHVGRLRKALSHRSLPDVIRTVRGAGYSLE